MWLEEGGDKESLKTHRDLSMNSDLSVIVPIPQTTDNWHFQIQLQHLLKIYCPLIEIENYLYLL